ncbi:hypothetical protein TRIUR3_05635 [Triticum urartu]|uniref:Inosine/uridine-preferring nucleoside hydrolase domain-containing protein n=1 Tax=Triticum urartu TaxID=4572 RepID=M7ZJV0_TRIUA|nr:hypothetical protein TRIUR3_05635 [Triticum urartu]
MEKARRTSSPSWTAAVALVSLFAVAGVAAAGAPPPRRILVDTDMDTDDLFALLYILKQDRSQFDVKAITISANAWIDAGHGVDQLYDILYMMGRDDIAVGVGGDGGISEAGEIPPDVGGYLPLIDQGYYMWDSFAAGVAFSSMRNGDANGANDFAELEYMNITVITSNKPYGVRDGSNPFFDGRATPKFGLKVGGVHSGHVQTGIRDSFCLVPGSNAGRCQDGYTKEVTGSEGVRVRVATSAKPNPVYNSAFDREFSKNFLEVLNLAKQAGRFNISTQFPYYREVLYKPDFINVSRGKPVIFDMDMSPGDFVSLIYLLKAPREVIDLKGVLVNGNGWANIASIDIIYDILHMMGRDDIPVGLGNTTAMGNPTLGCNNVYAIPLGSGGFIDSDTLYGLARLLPRSPRRYTPESTDDPEHRQPLAFEVWQSVRRQLGPGDKITLLTSGPLTNLANISLSDRDASSVIERIYVVGGLIRDGGHEKGNVFTVPSNRYAEFNMFLDPLAAKTVLESNLNITLIPLTMQRKAASFRAVLDAFEQTRQTPESNFVQELLSLLKDLRSKKKLYHHVDIFLGEVLGAVYMVQGSDLKSTLKVKRISVLADTMKSTDGQIVISKQSTKLVHVLSDFNVEIYYNRLANSLTNKKQSAIVASFEEQKAIWSRPPNNSGPGHNRFL